MDKHRMQHDLGPEMDKIRSCVNIASSLEVMLILAPLSSASIRIVAPPLPENTKVSIESFLLPHMLQYVKF